MGTGWGWMMMIFWIVILAAVVTLVAVWLVRRSGTGPDSGGAGTHGRDPEDILRERYARGEIDEEAYRRMRDELRS